MNDQKRFLIFTNDQFIKHSITKCDIQANENGHVTVIPRKQNCHCFWDGEPILNSTQVFTIPISNKLKKTLETNLKYDVGFGVFCSDHCAFAFDNKHFHGKHQFYIRSLRHYLNPLIKISDYLFEAPPPYLLLKYGGPFSIEEYRTLFDYSNSSFLQYIMKFIQVPLWGMTTSSSILSDVLQDHVLSFCKANHIETQTQIHQTNGVKQSLETFGLLYLQIQYKDQTFENHQKYQNNNSNNNHIQTKKITIVKNQNHEPKTQQQQQQQQQQQHIYRNIISHTLNNSVRIANETNRNEQTLSPSTSTVSQQKYDNKNLKKTKKQKLECNSKSCDDNIKLTLSTVSPLSSLTQKKKIKQRPLYFISKKSSLTKIFTQ